MPKKTLSFHDHIAIAVERLGGQSQEQVAKMFEVSTSLIGKLEKHNKQYQTIQKDLQDSIIRETGRLITQVQKPAADVRKLLDAQVRAFADMKTEAQKPVEAMTRAIAQIQSEVQQPTADVRKLLDAQVRAFADMKTEAQKPVEAMTRAIAQIQSEVQQPTADVKKVLDAQVRAFADMKTEMQKPVEADKSYRSDTIRSSAAHSRCKKVLDAQVRAFADMKTEMQKH